jgi:FkbM family methyltransferase
MPLKLKLLKPPIFDLITPKNIIPYLCQILGITRSYDIMGVKITLPPKHKLDTTRNTLTLYDRYFSFLAKILKRDEIVVDIGANIGDTAIPFLLNGNKVICVEPSSFFFSYLKKNLQRFEAGSNNVVFLNYFISSSTKKVDLVMLEGTAFAASSSQKAACKPLEKIDDKLITLDALLKQNDCIENLGLIKIDTDGFDYDVINSGLGIISKKKPILFFENQVNEINLLKYKDIYEKLQSLNYKLIAFDNSGVILSTSFNFDTVHSLNEYLIKTNFKAFHYMDILAYDEKDEFRVLESIARFRAEFGC